MFNGGGIIYKLFSDHCDKYYIGYTTKSLEERLERHELNYEEWLTCNFKSIYLSSFEILKYVDYKIEVLEYCPGFTRKELLERERYYQILNYPYLVNIVIPGKIPKSNETDTTKTYICCCGIHMLNKYRSRKKHCFGSAHKNKIREIHLQMIPNNPKFEIVELPSFELHDNVLTIHY